MSQDLCVVSHIEASLLPRMYNIETEYITLLRTDEAVEVVHRVDDAAGHVVLVFRRQKG
jgi:hypothetical protein